MTSQHLVTLKGDVEGAVSGKGLKVLVWLERRMTILIVLKHVKVVSKIAKGEWVTCSKVKTIRVLHQFLNIKSDSNIYEKKILNLFFNYYITKKLKL